jgi:6,7-dimethyl-8-ribityllumazine synthase
VTGKGAPSLSVDGAHDLRVAIVATLWYDELMAALVAGAVRACCDAGVATAATVVRVPGSFELSVVARALALKGFDAVVALGIVIRGGTPHFEYVCSAATDGLNRVALDTGVPIGFGLLTCDTEEQARDRSGLPGSQEDKGHEAAMAAISTAVLLRSL